MPIFIGALNNLNFDAAHSILGDPASDIVQSPPGTFTAGDIGGSVADNWSGTFPGSPAPTDITQISTTVADLSRGIIQYTFTEANGTRSAKIGGEVIGYNQTGVLVEQLTGYVTGQTSITLNPDYFIALSLTDLNTLEAGYTPPAAALVFGQTGPSTLLGISSVPEPSSIALFSVMALGLMMSRLPGVRQFFSAFR
jgi:hypothetical protein